MTEKGLRLTRVFVYDAVRMIQETKKSWICSSGLYKACAQHNHCLCSNQRLSHLTHSQARLAGRPRRMRQICCVRVKQTKVLTPRELHIISTSLSQPFSIILNVIPAKVQNKAKYFLIRFYSVCP